MKKQLIVLFLALIFFAVCSAVKPVQEVKGKKVVCILFKDTGFKTGIAGNLTKRLSKKGYRVVTGSVRQAKYYDASDYAAVVYMTELWAWHTPWHTKRYFRKHDEAKNIVFVITSDDPDVTITEPFDAVTSASTPDRAGVVVLEVMEKLERILR